MDLSDRLRSAMAEAGVTQKQLADAVGIKPPSVHGWLSGKAKYLKGQNLLRAAAALNVSDAWLATGLGPRERRVGQSGPPNASLADYRLVSGDEGVEGALHIPLTEARGSCGGGSIPHDEVLRSPLIKEPSWFKKYRIRPADAIAIWADGDSMADFIVDGDIVIFDKSKRTPKSGKIFLIEHPDGLRIKRLRREIDGTWVLESNSSDKRLYPDERISIEQADLLVILGEFVYRQGG